MGFLLLLILCVIILGYQFKSARKVEILENYSRSYLITMRIISVLFVLWGFFILQSPEFILITVLVAIIIIIHPYTTGLSKSEIIYHQWATGGFAPKAQKISEVSKFSTKDSENNFRLTLSIKNQFKIELNFAQEDKQKVLEYLQDIS